MKVIRCLAMFLISLFIIAGCTAKGSQESEEKNDPKKAQADWTVSPTFEADGYTLRGLIGSIGFIDVPFVAGKGNKYMWYLWGDALKGEKLKVIATKKGSNQKAKVFIEGAGTNNESKVESIPIGDQIPTSMSLPSPGLWALNLSIDGQDYGRIVVNVKQGK